MNAPSDRLWPGDFSESQRLVLVALAAADPRSITIDELAEACPAVPYPDDVAATLEDLVEIWGPVSEIDPGWFYGLTVTGRVIAGTL